MYQRQEDSTVQVFYSLYTEFAAVTPNDVATFVECLASTAGLARDCNDYPTDPESLRRAADSFVTAANTVFGFSLDLAVDDARQIDRFAERHLIDAALRPYFHASEAQQFSEVKARLFGRAMEKARVPNEPLLYFCMGSFWGEWQVHHRQAYWAIYAPLNPIQCFPDMIGHGPTICSHPFSQVCKKLCDPQGDNLAYKAHVSSSQKRYLPPYPLLASLVDAEHAIRELLPEPARRALDFEKAGDDPKAWELFCEAAMDEEQPQLLSRMIACAWRLEKYDMVDSISRRLLQRVPDHPLTCHNLAVLYSGQRDMMNEAVELLQRALQSDPNYSRAHITLASCLAQLGRNDEARQHAEWVRDNDSQIKPEAEKLLAELRPKGWFGRWLKK